MLVHWCEVQCDTLTENRAVRFGLTLPTPPIPPPGNRYSSSQTLRKHAIRSPEARRTRFNGRQETFYLYFFVVFANGEGGGGRALYGGFLGASRGRQNIAGSMWRNRNRGNPRAHLSFPITRPPTNPPTLRPTHHPTPPIHLAVLWVGEKERGMEECSFPTALFSNRAPIARQMRACIREIVQCLGCIRPGIGR